MAKEQEKVEIGSLIELIEKTVNNLDKQNDKIEEHIKKLGKMQAEFLLELGKILKNIEIDAKQEITQLEKQVNIFKKSFIITQLVWLFFFIVVIIVIFLNS